MTTHEIKVWDGAVRIFHWALVIAFAVAYLSEGDDLMTVHVWAGYAIAALVIFRLLWGVLGTEHARFRDFVVAPSAAFSYLKGVFRGTARRYLGHNPAGGWMILLLLAMLTLISLTGIALYGVGDHAGPLAGFMAGYGENTEDFLEELHEVLVNATLILVGIHLLGVVWESVLHRESLVKAMLTGRKRA